MRREAAILESLKGDLLRLMHRGALDGLELLHELCLERVVLGLSPRAVLLQGLGDRNLWQSGTGDATHAVGVWSILPTDMDERMNPMRLEEGGVFATAADLACNLGLGEGLELGKVLIEQRLARLEALGVARTARRTRCVPAAGSGDRVSDPQASLSLSDAQAEVVDVMLAGDVVVSLAAPLPSHVLESHASVSNLRHVRRGCAKRHRARRDGQGLGADEEGEGGDDRLHGD
eukprot:scaffold199421_cov25-Tisochrysis_lutea.AAC.1